MAIIFCSECGKQISSGAIQCPNCGFQRSLSNSTVELTSKKIKLRFLIVTSIVILCIILLFISSEMPYEWRKDHEDLYVSIDLALLSTIALSVLYFIYLKIKRWWHHG